MAGLVACGFVTLLNILFNGVAGRLRSLYYPPDWRRVWLLSALPLSASILYITMTYNAPTLPLSHAIRCVLATLIGLAFALLPGEWAARRSVDLAWLVVDGVGLMPVLILMRAIELPGRGLNVSPILAWGFAIGSVIGGLIWLRTVAHLRHKRGRAMPHALAQLAAGLSVSYVIMPLVHYLIATPPGYKYITTAANFFAINPFLQVVVFVVAAAMVFGADRVRRNLHHRTSSS